MAPHDTHWFEHAAAQHGPAQEPNDTRAACDAAPDRLMAVASLQRLHGRGRHYEDIVRLPLDATDILSLPAARVRELIVDFDLARAPYVPRLPVDDARALAVAFGGPTSVVLSIKGFLFRLGLLPPPGAAGDRCWPTEEILDEARRRAGYTGPAVAPLGSGRTYKILDDHVAVVREGRGWRFLGEFATRTQALKAIEAAGEG